MQSNNVTDTKIKYQNTCSRCYKCTNVQRNRNCARRHHAKWHTRKYSMYVKLNSLQNVLYNLRTETQQNQWNGLTGMIRSPNQKPKRRERTDSRPLLERFGKLLTEKSDVRKLILGSWNSATMLNIGRIAGIWWTGCTPWTTMRTNYGCVRTCLDWHALPAN